MGEVAHDEAKARGEHVSQELRKLSDDLRNGVSRPDAAGVLHGAADLVEWLEKERDRLIDATETSED